MELGHTLQVTEAKGKKQAKPTHCLIPGRCMGLAAPSQALPCPCHTGPSRGRIFSVRRDLTPAVL